MHTNEGARCADGIGPFQQEWRTEVFGQRLGKHESTIDGAQQRKSSREPERHAHSIRCKRAAQSGADSLAKTRGCKEKAKHRRSLLDWRRVGDVSSRGGYATRERARNGARYEEPPEVRRKRHDDKVHSGAERRRKNDGSPPIAIRKSAL